MPVLKTIFKNVLLLGTFEAEILTIFKAIHTQPQNKTLPTFQNYFVKTLQ